MLVELFKDFRQDPTNQKAKHLLQVIFNKCQDQLKSVFETENALLVDIKETKMTLEDVFKTDAFHDLVAGELSVAGESMQWTKDDFEKIFAKISQKKMPKRLSSSLLMDNSPYMEALAKAIGKLIGQESNPSPNKIFNTDSQEQNSTQEDKNVTDTVIGKKVYEPPFEESKEEVTLNNRKNISTSTVGTKPSSMGTSNMFQPHRPTEYYIQTSESENMLRELEENCRKYQHYMDIKNQRKSTQEPKQEDRTQRITYLTSIRKEITKMVEGLQKDPRPNVAKHIEGIAFYLRELDNFNTPMSHKSTAHQFLNQSLVGKVFKKSLNKVGVPVGKSAEVNYQTTMTRCLDALKQSCSNLAMQTSQVVKKGFLVKP